MSTLAAEISTGWGVSAVTLYYTLYKTDGTTAQARTTTGVAEVGTSGVYTARPTFDSAWGVLVTADWDDGTFHARETIQNPATIYSGGAVASVASGVTVSDKTGFSLSGAGVTAVQSGLMTSAGYTAPNNALLADVAADVADLPDAFPDAVDIAVAVRTNLATELGIVSTNLDAKVSDVAGGGGGATAAEIAAALAGQTIAFASPVLSDGSIEIVAGDDYTGDRAIVLTLTGYTGTATPTIVFRLLRIEKYNHAGDTTAAALSVTCTATVDDTTLTVTIPPTHTQTATLSPAREAGTGRTIYRGQVIDLATDSTLWSGKVTVLRRIEAT
jgi:hypothetical protein